MISDDLAVLDEPKDRTKWIWLGVVVLFVGAIGVLWVANRTRGDQTQVRAKHILIKCNKDDLVDRSRALELVTELKKRIAGGENFNSLAKQFSNDDGSASRGGDLGYYPRHTFEPEFEKYVWAAPLGQLSDIIQTSSGFHLVIVTDRHISPADAYEMELEQKADSKNKADSTAAPAKP